MFSFSEARRNRSGAFMRSQVRLKSLAGPLHRNSSIDLNTGTAPLQGDALSATSDPSDASLWEHLPDVDIARKPRLRLWPPIPQYRDSRLQCPLPQPDSPESKTV